MPIYGVYPKTNSTYPEYVAIQERRRAAGEETVQREYNKKELREQDKRRKKRDEEDKDKKAREDAAEAEEDLAEVDRANAEAEEQLKADTQMAEGIHGQNERRGKDEQRRERERMRDASESEEHEVVEWPAVSTMIPSGFLVWAVVTGEKEHDSGQRIRGTASDSKSAKLFVVK